MEVPNIQQIMAQSSANNASSASTTDDAIEGLNDTYNNFLLLLTKQLQNQDPLNPMDTAQFTQQLVGFSQVEQQIASNKSLEKLIGLQSATNAFGAVAFIGNEVAVNSNHVALKDGKAKFEYTIDQTASKAVMTVVDSRGQVVLVQEANKGVGTYKVDWNGKDAFGNQLPDGDYRVAVSYADDQGETYAADITSFGIVDSTEIADGEVKLFVGSVGFSIDQILKVTKPATNDTADT
jgi:flagellar basal-body rod modification protein FlgD